MSELVAPEVGAMAGPEALPRRNGELVFEAPWQGRVFGLAVALVRSHGLEWDEFRLRLIAAIAADPTRPYFESWTAALEALVIDLGLGERGDLARRAASHTV
jgi:nitrile hydratase accessory protein